MTYILDTHVLLWSMIEPQRLSQSAKRILTTNGLHKFICTTSIWEIAIKNRIGKLPFIMKMSELLSEAKLSNIGLIELSTQHIEIYETLPLLHRDPFDGIIVATALLEGMTVITSDENLQRYDVPWVW
jgi:PIN domain nuclease of toxin-antitoxin system